MAQSSFNGFVLPKPERKSGGGLWMHDWSAFQTVYDWSGTLTSIPNATYTTFVERTGEGVLTFCRAGSPSTNARSPSIRVTIDGVPYVFDGLTTGSGSLSNMITHPLYFKQSIKIELFNHDTGATGHFLDYTLLIKSGNPQTGKQSILLGSRKAAYNQTSSTSMVDALNITGSGYLLDLESVMVYVSAAPRVLCSIEIDGVMKMNARVINSLSSNPNDRYPFFNGPIRFNTSLIIRHSINVAGINSQLRSNYLLD